MRELAPAFPDATFEIVGSVCTALNVPLTANIVLHGLVTESRKTEILAAWDVALNPVESGGGSSLKLPDYMAHGLVTLNTAWGARGFAVERCDAGLIVQRHEFRSALARLLCAGWTVVQLLASMTSSMN